jgi:hypothetical protein
MSSDFIAGRATRNPPFCYSLYFLWCMAHRSLHAVTKVYYKSMSYFAMVSRVDTWYHGLACSAKVSWGRYTYHDPSCTRWAWVKSQANPHSSEQDTQPVVFLISKQAAPYWTRGGTCCPGVSTPKIRSLADLSITCHDGVNHLHHTNHYSNHIIDRHTVKSHLDGWETTSLTLRHKPNTTS